MFDNFFPATDPVLIFAILVIITLIAPIVSEKFKLPGIIGLIIAGIAFGPHGLAILERSNEIELLGTIGLLYIMFLAGLELDMVQFIKNRHHSLIFGVLTFSIPLLLGTLMGNYILGFPLAASILLSSMFSSHTLITYPLASKLGLSKQKAVTTTIGGTLITDTAALLVLAIIAASHKGSPNFFFWIKMLLYMVIYVAGVLLILPKISRWFFRNIATDGIISFTGVLVAVFICSYLAYISGLEPIIGAFIAGLILNTLIPENSALMNRIQFVGHSLFIPFFLISVGMLVNIGLLLTGKETIIIAVAMVIAGIVTKWIAAWTTQNILSYTNNEGMLIWGLSVNQAAATLAAVMVGYNIGIFNEAILTGTIIMILATSLLGSWLTDRFARLVALAEDNKPYSNSDAPHRILIPLANPKTAEELINIALLIRKKNSHEPLYPLTVAQAGDNTEEKIAIAEKILGYAVVKAVSADVPVVPIARAAIDTTTGIKQASIDLRVSTIILGWKGWSTSKSKAFGKMLDNIKAQNPQFLLITRCPAPINTMKRVVVAIPPLIEHQSGFETALRTIKTLAHQLGASLLILTVTQTLNSVKTILKSNPPKLKEEYFVLEKWDKLLEWIKNNISTANDLFILFSIRKGKLAWQPNLSRLPKIISYTFSQLNFIVCFNPEMQWNAYSNIPGINTSDTLSLLPRQNIKLNLKNTTPYNAIVSLLKSGFPDNNYVIGKTAQLLYGKNSAEPMELYKGTALLHAHIPEIYSSKAFLGINLKGWIIPPIEEKIYSLFLLLSPKDATPEIHLKALSNLVIPLHKSKNPNILLSAKNVDEIINIFSN